MQRLLQLLALVCLASSCSVPDFEFQSPTTEALNACRDGKLSPGETDIDCGGNCPCVTAQCTNTHCVPQAATGSLLPTTGWLATAATSCCATAPRLVFDGNVATEWDNGLSQAPGMWFQWDMVKPQVFFGVTVTCTTTPTDFGKTIRLSGSLDGTTFTELRTNIAGENVLKIKLHRSAIRSLSKARATQLEQRVLAHRRNQRQPLILNENKTALVKRLERVAQLPLSALDENRNTVSELTQVSRGGIPIRFSSCRQGPYAALAPKLHELPLVSPCRMTLGKEVASVP